MKFLLKTQLLILGLLLMTINAFSISLTTNSRKDTTKNTTYSKLSIGYGFITGVGTMNASHKRLNSPVYSNKPFSYGKGVNICYNFITMFHPNIGLELGIGGLIGGVNETENYYPQDNVVETSKFKANSFRVNPSLLFMADLSTFSPYVKVGLLGDLGNATTEYIASGDGNTYGSKWVFTGKPALGHTSALGLIIKSKAGHVDVFFEASYIGMGKKFKSGRCTSYMVNGVEQIQYMDVINRQVVYEETVSDLDNQDPNKPYKSVGYKSNYNSIGVNIGLMIKMK